jgi:surface polysaccharide O-acyltransferase-like enzyme
LTGTDDSQTILSNGGSSRIVFFDYLRVFAVFLICVLHTASFGWYGAAVKSVNFAILNAYKALTCHAVLLFVMISGALFLGRDIPVKKLYGKYILRLLVAFLFWSFVFAIVSNYKWGVLSVLEVTVSSHYHLWFIPMMIGLYVAQPILKLFARKEALLRYFLVLSAVFTIILPFAVNLLHSFGEKTMRLYAGFVSDRISDMHMQIVFGYSFFFMMGWFLSRHELCRKLRMIIYICGALSFIFSFLLTLFHSIRVGAPMNLFHENFSLFVCIEVLSTFVFFKHAPKKPLKTDGFIRRLSKYSFGVFLIHPLLIEFFLNRFPFLIGETMALWTVPLIGLTVFALSMGLSALINLIPFVNKYIV